MIMNTKQRKIKIEPRIKLNYNTCSSQAEHFGKNKRKKVKQIQFSRREKSRKLSLQVVIFSPFCLLFNFLTLHCFALSLEFAHCEIKDNGSVKKNTAL